MATEISHADHQAIVAEVNARLRKTGVDRKLDQSNSLDRTVLIPAWLAAYDDLKAQFLAGTFVPDPWDATASRDFTDYTAAGAPVAAPPPTHSAHPAHPASAAAHAAATRAPAHAAPTISPEIQKKLYAETDARFAAQGGVSRKLDPKNPIDAKLIPAWMDAYRKVKAEWAMGRIVWTYDHPFVAPALAAAERATARGAASMDAAAAANMDVARARAMAVANASDPEGQARERAAQQEVQRHLADVRAAHVEAQQALASAAAQQPPTVSHAHVRQGAHEVQQFVMNGAGQGVPVFGHGGDVMTAMQVAEAPENVRAAAANWDMTGGFGDAAPLEDFRTPPRPHDAKTSSTGKAIAIGAAIVAALGLGAWAVSRRKSVRRGARARAALGPSDTGAYWQGAIANNKRRSIA